MSSATNTSAFFCVIFVGARRPLRNYCKRLRCDVFVSFVVMSGYAGRALLICSRCGSPDTFLYGSVEDFCGYRKACCVNFL